MNKVQKYHYFCTLLFYMHFRKRRKEGLRLLPLTILALIIGTSAGCNPSGPSYPEGFSSFADTAKVAFFMANSQPDSVARFICYEALKQDSTGQIDSLHQSVMYAYLNYRDSNRVVFGEEIDRIASIQTPENRARLFYLAAQDPYRLGYKFGKEYGEAIKEGNPATDSLRLEYSAFSGLAEKDSLFFHKFKIGVKTAFNGLEIPDSVFVKAISLK